MKESCGVFGIYGHPEASKITYLGLYALQHRGQESAGIVSSDGKHLHSFVKMGLVADVFTKESFRQLPGSIAIGHCRYSTTGTSTIENAQPVCASYSKGAIAVAHNGNLVNALKLRRELEERGSIFSSTTDSEVIVHLIARSRAKTFVDKVADSLKQLQGAFSLIIMNEDTLIAVKDSYGFRPLSLGKLGASWCVASESCAFDIIEAKYIRAVKPGEMIVITKNSIKSLFPFPKTKHTACIFEFIYFSRPDSFIFGRNCEETRKKFGRALAKEKPVKADVVICVPDSSTCAAIGYSHASGIPFDMGFIRNHYIGRTFIEPSQAIRDFGAKIKYNPVSGLIKGKRVIVVDDSIVRGTTSRKLVKMLRKAGAREVHWRVGSPPIISPCHYGIDTPTKKELIASSQSIEKIRKFIGADSLAYLSLKRMKECVKEDAGEYCMACFSGEYPVTIFDPHSKMKLEKHLNNHELPILKQATH